MRIGGAQEHGGEEVIKCSVCACGRALAVSAAYPKPQMGTLCCPTLLPALPLHTQAQGGMVLDEEGLEAVLRTVSRTSACQRRLSRASKGSTRHPSDDEQEARASAHEPKGAPAPDGEDHTGRAWSRVLPGAAPRSINSSRDGSSSSDDQAVVSAARARIRSLLSVESDGPSAAEQQQLERQLMEEGLFGTSTASFSYKVRRKPQPQPGQAAAIPVPPSSTPTQQQPQPQQLVGPLHRALQARRAPRAGGILGGAVRHQALGGYGPGAQQGSLATAAPLPSPVPPPPSLSSSSTATLHGPAAAAAAATMGAPYTQPHALSSSQQAANAPRPPLPSFSPFRTQQQCQALEPVAPITLPPFRAPAAAAAVAEAPHRSSPSPKKFTAMAPIPLRLPSADPQLQPPARSQPQQEKSAPPSLPTPQVPRQAPPLAYQLPALRSPAAAATVAWHTAPQRLSALAQRGALSGATVASAAAADLPHQKLGSSAGHSRSRSGGALAPLLSRVVALMAQCLEFNQDLKARARVAAGPCTAAACCAWQLATMGHRCSLATRCPHVPCRLPHSRSRSSSQLLKLQLAASNSKQAARPHRC